MVHDRVRQAVAGADDVRGLGQRPQGTAAGRRDGAQHLHVAPAMLKGPRQRDEHFEIRATRAPLPAGTTRCNIRGQKPSIALTGDLQLQVRDRPAAGRAGGQGVGPSGDVPCDQAVRLNQGKARALEGSLEVFYGGQGTSEALINRAPMPGFCTKESNTTFRCRFENLDPGEQMEVIVRLTYAPTPDSPKWDHISGTVGFTARCRAGHEPAKRLEPGRLHPLPEGLDSGRVQDLSAPFA